MPVEVGKSNLGSGENSTWGKSWLPLQRECLGNA